MSFLKVAISCFLIILTTFSQISYSDGVVYETYGFPDPVDVAARRELLGNEFPNISADKKRLDGLTEYRRNLELYRIQKLEAFNEQILSICSELKNTEKLVNLAWRKGDIAINAHEQWALRIKEERTKCDSNNYSASPYWRVYVTYLDLYKNESRESKIALDKCYSNDDCRQRKI